ncbi:hypothetical protein [Actinotalea fermentans]|uniref:DUF4406 domain-containing protein n=1 Tax=Actinotalea fermentans TaxID=43671 RepID=A0A511YXJ1_9CELL|nr:hypothetical protein [Actinotalea fermentans]KGM15954.1 hypothetical protein N867_04295 [Actinotalea fermentans ATCC 43279 = JCM 9966 = DSM 3133]GEN79918.1 hypothetical protein AFE02nite_16520 [Actinotalea fermentans]
MTTHDTLPTVPAAPVTAAPAAPAADAPATPPAAAPAPAGSGADRPLLVLIAGPYRSGTGDDPALMAANLARLESAAWPVFERGHVPMIGEWVALPVLRGAGAVRPGGEADVTAPLADAVMYPTAERLLAHCDAVLRLPGDSRGADQDVALARERGLPVWTSVEEIPARAPR